MGQRVILIIGGGIIGLSVAEALSRRGLKPIVLEKGDFGREASWAGAGYLSLKSAALAGGPFLDLSLFSFRMYEPWVRLLEQESGMECEFRPGGSLEVAYGDGDAEALKKLHEDLRKAGVPAVWLSGSEARGLEPELSPEAAAAIQMPDTAQVRPPRLIHALLEILRKRGVELRDQTPVSALVTEGGKVRGVRTAREEIRGDAVVLAGGAWSGQLAERVGIHLPIKPIRGQVVMFHGQPNLVNRVLFTQQAYLVPRQDGRIYVGSTLEDVGFNKNTTLQGTEELEEGAYRAVPKLRLAQLESRWAGLRPGTPDGRPFLGPVPGVEGLVLACGHYTHGLLLAPATGLLIDQYLRGEESDVPLEAFALNRPPQDPVGI